MCLGGCGGSGFVRGKEIDYVLPQPERYKNHIEIDGQWGASAATGEDGQYGIGDPFVMRHNGKYYLYPSTSDPCDGIKVFESSDLINWTYKGLAVAESEKTAHGAYAPEVVYYNGWFYMCQSRAGKGHYIYRSSSPTEGFTLFSTSNDGNRESLDDGNLGMGIDGSFYVSDSGKLYIMHTSTPAGLKFNEILNPEDIRPSTIGKAEVLGDANLRHWIEGPGIFRRGEYSYLTYTGNHVISKGYRVAYSYARNLKSLREFTQPADNVTIIDTHDEHYGLGHSSNVLGPDLDSVYTAYHSLVGRGPARRYNVDRYLTSGSLLTANGVTHRAVAVPAAPYAQSVCGDALALHEDILAVSAENSPVISDGYFTAEYNFTPCDGQILYFGYGNGGGYEIRLTNNGITLQKDGKTLGETKAKYPSDKLNTVRVENGDGIGYVYLNGMRVITYEATAAKGAVGYSKRDGVEYTAFTNDVFGTSDFEALKNFPTVFPATSYLKGENRGFSIANAKREKGGLRAGEKQSIEKVESEEVNAVVLGAGDWVKYAVDIASDDTYSLSARVAANCAAKIKITIGDSEITCDIPAVKAESDTVKISLGRIKVKAGVQTMRVQTVSGTAKIVSFEARDNAANPQRVALGDFKAEGGKITVTDTSVTAENSGDVPGAALWGNSGISDFEAKLKIVFDKANSSDVGIMLRASDYSYYNAQPKQSWRGYYLKISDLMLTLSRYDYGDTPLAAVRIDGGLSSGEHSLSLLVKSNRIEVTLDGKYNISVKDDAAFMHGRLGVFAGSGNLKITALNYKTL